MRRTELDDKLKIVIVEKPDFFCARLKRTKRVSEGLNVQFTVEPEDRPLIEEQRKVKR